MFRTLPRHEEDGLGLPYPVVLIDGAEEEIDERTGERVGIFVPGMESLVAAIAVARALHPLQLHGSEVRFIRRVIGMPAKEFAEALGMDPATLSRWENGRQTVGEWADKEVRMAAVILLADRVPGLGIDRKEVVGLRVVPRTEDDWPTIEMRRVHRGDAGGSERADCWDALRLAA